ncbi:hypothetical protein ANRL1_00955 [Anaerolineae bacterium]|nr:hypothetical protein ANRL1_00955 [Anaerolineae bacterium]
MKTPYGQECKYYYADYYRGKNTQECRLILANPSSDAWKPALCQTCPVPEILRANACPNLAFRGRVGKSFFGMLQKIKIESACREYRVEVKQPKVGCGKCHLPVKRDV